MLRLVRRTDSPHWQIKGTLGGVRIRESTGTDSRSHAETTLAKRQKEILDRQTYGESVTATFAEAVNLYLDEGGEARYLKPLVLRWGTWRLAAITPLEIARAARELYPTGKPSTIRRQVYTPLIAILNSAAEAGLCVVPKIRGPKVKHAPVEPADDAWIAALLNSRPKAIYRDGSAGERRQVDARARLRAVVLFMTLTSARVSEAAALRWRDVDLKRGRAYLHHTKNGDPALVPLAAEVVAAIGALSPGAPDGLVFGYSSRFSVRQAINRAVSAAKLEHHGTHQIGRHAFAGRLLDLGYTLKDVQEAGRWSDIGIVARHYGHRERSAVDKAIHDAGTKLARDVNTGVSNVLPYRKKTR